MFHFTSPRESQIQSRLQSLVINASMASTSPLCIVALFLLQHIAASNLTDAINSFQTELNTLFCDGLSVGGSRCNGSYGIQNFINSFHEHFDDNIENVSSTVQQIIDRVDTELNLRAGILTSLADAIDSTCNFSISRWGTASHSEYFEMFDSLYFAGNDDRAANLPSDMAQSAIYGKDVSMTKSTYRLPNDVDYTDIYIQRDAIVKTLISLFHLLGFIEHISFSNLLQVSYMLEDTMVSLHDKYCVDR